MSIWESAKRAIASIIFIGIGVLIWDGLLFLLRVKVNHFNDLLMLWGAFAGSFYAYWRPIP